MHRHLERFMSAVVAGWLLLICNVVLAQADEPLEDWIYSVKSGDNPWNITERFLDGMKYWPMVTKRNAIADPLHIPVGSSLRIPISWIRTASGNVVVTGTRAGGCLSKGEGAVERILSAGDSVVAGLRLQTNKDGFCGLRFPDGSQVLLLANSELTLDKLIVYAMTGMFDLRATLLKGRVEVTARKAAGPASRFEISTPQGVTSVRGTQYRAASETDAGRVEVLEGKVEVKNSLGAEVLPEGTGSYFTANAAPLPPIPLLPAPDLSALPKTLRQVPPTIHFSEVTGAVAYRAQWSRDLGFTDWIGQARAEKPEIRLDGMQPGEYGLRVRAIDARGLEGREAAVLIKVEAGLPAPQGCASQGGWQFVQPDLVLLCASVPEAAKYRFQVARDTQFKDIVEDWIQPEPRLDLRLPTLGEFHWRMAALDRDMRMGDFSDSARLLRLEVVPKLVLLELTHTAMTLHWSPHDSRKRYRVQLSTEQDFRKTVVDSTTRGDRLVIARPFEGIYYVRLGVLSTPDAAPYFGDSHRLNVPTTTSGGWFAPAGLLLILAL